MSSIQVAQRAMGYRSAVRCGNCRHVESRAVETTRGGVTEHRCTLGGFWVSAWMVCDKHEPERRSLPEGQQT